MHLRSLPRPPATTPKRSPVRYKGHSISDLLDMPIVDTLKVLENIPQIRVKLETLVGVGLGYIQLRANRPPRFRAAKRNASNSLKSFRKRQTGRTLYILDEPTTGAALRRR